MKRSLFKIIVVISMSLIGLDAMAADFQKISKASVETISKQIDDFGFGSMIVELHSSNNASILAENGVEGAIESANKWAKSSFISSIGSDLKTKIADEFDYLPAVVVTTNSQADIEELKRNSAVKGIYANNWSKPSLAESIPLVYENQKTSKYDGNNEWVVAVLDTGVDTSHSFFSSNGVSKVVAEACYSGAGSSDSRVVSLCPRRASSSVAVGSGKNCVGVEGCDHGTHVAGIAVGDRDAASGADGVAHKGKLMPIQVFTRINDKDYCDGSASCVITVDSDWIKGLERVYALRNQHKFAAVNLSLGGGIFSGTCDDLNPIATNIINLLREAGIATVVASGNNGWNYNMNFPGCISSAITVGATDDSDVEVGFSNGNENLDIYAPGYKIVSSVPGNRYASFSGTSMAAPHVAGAFAVLRHANPTASVAKLERILKSVGPDVALPGHSITRKRLDIKAAITRLKIALAPIYLLLLED